MVKNKVNRKLGNFRDKVDKTKHPNVLKKSAKSEINEIFQVISDKKLERQGLESQLQKATKFKTSKAIHNKEIGQISSKIKPIRYTEDGLPVYKLEDLKIGQGGGTPDCPFNCECCY
ncbi:uncharacterized protein CMU_008000 [Cryptosporidium muris RN66]|uniref:Uncharacterized protein n=1 Tax=Cryptosporidium muris (strain RN66) TaxID=441375 RepID=B6ADL8_CRYMR|nr:uncharacterized protein CMU_008000 [Cryptosporidium muris RN66]EEA06309.1 hypothetical protein, conserved [Cryptosporidium muris RN66]|eukprot:XP_002140658.1 hypothetical protein [Cryptosporidium muris RN66]